MARVFFTEHFVKELGKKFSEAEGNKILDLLGTLEDSPMLDGENNDDLYESYLWLMKRKISEVKG